MVPAPPLPGRPTSSRCRPAGLCRGGRAVVGALVAVVAGIAAVGAVGLPEAAVLVMAVLVATTMAEALALHRGERRGRDGGVALLDDDRVGRAVGGVERVGRDEALELAVLVRRRGRRREVAHAVEGEA